MNKQTSDETLISVSAKRLLDCHKALIVGDVSEAYDALYWAIQEMPNADPFQPFKHVEELVK